MIRQTSLQALDKPDVLTQLPGLRIPLPLHRAPRATVIAKKKIQSDVEEESSRYGAIGKSRP